MTEESDENLSKFYDKYDSNYHLVFSTDHNKQSVGDCLSGMKPEPLDIAILQEHF
jgi:hypothetical protein